MAFKLILKENYTNYSLACEALGTQTLYERRIKLCKNFASKNLQSNHSMFTEVTTNIKTRQKKKVVKEYNCNFRRFYNSSLPYLARLLNEN